MKSTGISHDITQRIGDKFTKQLPKAKSVGKAVKGATVIAVGVTTAIEEVSDKRQKKACSIYDSRMKKCSSF